MRFIRIIYYILIFIAVISILAIVVFARDREHTTCRLAKQMRSNNQHICVYVGANYTQWNEYIDMSAGNVDCPREIKCKYRPNEKPFTLKNVIKSIKDAFD